MQYQHRLVLTHIRTHVYVGLNWSESQVNQGLLQKPSLVNFQNLAIYWDSQERSVSYAKPIKPTLIFNKT